MTARPDLLHLFLDNERIGEVTRRRDRLELVYDERYRAEPSSTPASVSMPLTASAHSGRTLANFLDGLLPDNDAVRSRWSQMFACRKVPFDLLAHVGEDCAGGLQFVRPDRVNKLLPGEREPVDNKAIGDWIRGLRVDPAGWLNAGGEGQFSLAGAQSKFALLQDNGAWWQPSGATPTTHIFKPATGQFREYEINEHLSLRLASAVGLLAARSEVMEFDGERAVVVERYDRFDDGDEWHRIHQEDICQALGLPPERKYESLGGPGADRVTHLLRQVTGRVAPESVERFASSLAFNWIIGGTDGHAKNYSLLLAGDEVRLSPLYDLGSALPYVSTTPIRRDGELVAARLRMAMRVGKVYGLREVRRGSWDDLEVNLSLASGFADRVRRMAENVIEQIPTVVAEAGVDLLASDFPRLFVRKISAHARNCLHVLDGKPPASWR